MVLLAAQVVVQDILAVLVVPEQLDKETLVEVRSVGSFIRRVEEEEQVQLVDPPPVMQMLPHRTVVSV